MTKRMRYIQLVGDALIPLLGYFLWDWNLYFIVLFYMADMIINEVVIFYKARKIAEFDPKENSFVPKFLISVLLFTISLLLIHLTMKLYEPEISFAKEITLFWTYKDMGMQQGYILIPLLVLLSVQRYKLEFLMTAKYRSIKQVRLWRSHYRAYLFLIGGVGLTMGILSFVHPADWIILLGVIAGTSTYQIVFSE